jgi:hypothetical protein
MSRFILIRVVAMVMWLVAVAAASYGAAVVAVEWL